MSERPTESSCELPAGVDPARDETDRPDGAAAADAGATRDADTGRGEASRVLRFDGFRWAGVEVAAYGPAGPGWRGVARHALVGEAGEAAPFHLRYFEVRPGGHTTYERHEHRHVVIVIRGRGEVRIGDRWTSVGFGDVVYVAPLEPHQFRCAGDEPFGFLCVVSARRDRPRPLADPRP